MTGPFVGFVIDEPPQGEVSVLDRFTAASRSMSRNEGHASRKAIPHLNAGDMRPFLSKRNRKEYGNSIDLKNEVHERWRRRFRTTDNQRRFRTFLDEFFHLIEGNQPAGRSVLDAGCGSGEKSIELSKRDYNCVSVDVSDWALRNARKAIKQHDLSDKIVLLQEDLSRMNFANNTFDYLLCWGVLMHIKELSSVLDELTRVLAPGGFLIVNEINMHSLESRIFRQVANLSSKTVSVRKAPYGVEIERKIGKSEMFVRHSDLRSLVSGFQRRGLVLDHELPDQITEAYKYFGEGWCRNMVQGGNIRLRKSQMAASVAFSKTLVFRKE